MIVQPAFVRVSASVIPCPVGAALVVKSTAASRPASPAASFRTNADRIALTFADDQLLLLLVKFSINTNAGRPVNTNPALPLVLNVINATFAETSSVSSWLVLSDNTLKAVPTAELIKVKFLPVAVKFVNPLHPSGDVATTHFVPAWVDKLKVGLFAVLLRSSVPAVLYTFQVNVPPVFVTVLKVKVADVEVVLT